MNDWRKIKLGEFLEPYRQEHIIENEQIYRQATISKNHGVSFRGSKFGKDIGRKRQFVIDLQTYPNTVLFTRQGVLDGAIGIAPLEIDQCVVTENMPLLSVNIKIIEIKFLRKLLLSQYLFDKIRLLTVVGSAQKSIHEKDLLNIEIELPTLEIQKKECIKFDALDVYHKVLKDELKYQQNLIKKLRQQLLQEAIEGKLTAEWRTQNREVEPASELLAHIQAEKAQLIKEQKIKKQKNLPPITETEKPYVLPDGWVWCRLGEVTCGFQYGTSSKSMESGKIPVLRMGNIQKGEINWNGLVYSNDDNETETFQLKEGDLLFNRTNSRELVGKTGLYRGEQVSIFAGYLVRFQMAGKCDSEFTNYVMNSLLHSEWCNEVKTDAIGQSNINATKLSKFRFPLPPLPEQQAIVAKVDKMLALCDQLENQISSNQSHAEQLMQAVLTEAFTVASD